MPRRDTRIVEIHPVTPDRWLDLVDLFERPGPRGAWPRTSACYCMFWRLPPADYEDGFRQRSLDNVGGGANKEAMEALVVRGTVPGLLAFREGQPIGWVAVSAARRARPARPRADARLRTTTPGDERTWSISCFYVHRSEWRTGVGAALLAAAVARAREHGATTVEGYPVKAGSVDPYTGYDTMFAAAGLRAASSGQGSRPGALAKRASQAETMPSGNGESFSAPSAVIEEVVLDPEAPAAVDIASWLDCKNHAGRDLAASGLVRVRRLVGACADAVADRDATVGRGSPWRRSRRGSAGPAPRGSRPAARTAMASS